MPHNICNVAMDVPSLAVPWLASQPGILPRRAAAASIQSKEAASCTSRRQLMLLGLGTLGASALHSKNNAAVAKDIEVGAYLPPDEKHPGFVRFQATRRDTPALRAGNVQPYEFILPAKWKQERIANILSGNYCQPKCAEPWVEVKFDDAKEGSLQVIAAPLVRLTNKPNASIEEIGSPDKLISALGPFVTGDSYDPDEVIDSYATKRDGETFYYYALETPYAKSGSHNLAAATAKGSVVILFVVSADDKQWARSQDVLKTILESFRA